MDFLIIFLISAFAALMQASVGFGFAVLFTPLLSLVMSTRDAIALSLLLSMSLWFCQNSGLIDDGVAIHASRPLRRAHVLD